MRYLVTANVKAGREHALADAIEDGTLGPGSIAGSEYLRNMECARRLRDGSVKWMEVCYCTTPLDEERPYWQEYFELLRCRMRTRGRVAGISTATNPGPVRTATAPTRWKRAWRPGERCSSRDLNPSVSHRNGPIDAGESF